jgi:transcription elongation factor GreA
MMANDRIPMTREGYERLRAELAQLRDVEMLEVTKRVAAARDMGDLSENAEYHAAREDQGMLQARINLLSDKLSRAELVDPSKLPKDAVVLGATVRIKDLEFDDEETFQIVGPGEDNPDQNKILPTSPIARGLMGKKKGEVAEIEAPRGMMRFEVLEISFGG